ncbi:MAG: type I restriction endonuclease subunit R, partial [Limnobacter sp.]|nr:type I restriction endonuclease subunit R [Limnobacter sp.]
MKAQPTTEQAVKTSACQVLGTLGWQFLSPRQALEARAGKAHSVVLTEILRQQLAQFRFVHTGKHYPLSGHTIDALIAQLANPALNEGLLAVNEKLYNHLLYGLTVTEFINGKKVSPTVMLIDWHHSAANQFHVVQNFEVAPAGISAGGSKGSRSPGLVCFVNGIALGIIEVASPERQTGSRPTVQEAIAQSLRNQWPGEIPALYAYAQLLLAIDGQQGLYGTCGTPAEFWAVWREEDLPAAQQADCPQNELLISLLTPERLLELTRFFILFDQKAGKVVARYPQVFGIKRLLERIQRKNQRPENPRRQGGVIW